MEIKFSKKGFISLHVIFIAAIVLITGVTSITKLSNKGAETGKVTSKVFNETMSNVHDLGNGSTDIPGGDTEVKDKYYTLNGVEFKCSTTGCPAMMYREGIKTTEQEMTGKLFTKKVSNSSDQGEFVAPTGTIILEVEATVSATGYEDATAAVYIDDTLGNMAKSTDWNTSGTTKKITYSKSENKSGFKWRIYADSDRDSSTAELNVTKWIEKLSVPTIDSWSEWKVCELSCPLETPTLGIETKNIVSYEK